MNQLTDIRDRAHLPGSEVKKLNFIKDSKTLVFRKYYRSGLRSHIFEVLLAEAVLKETQGEIIDGIRMFPRARPVKMFRILRNRFESKTAVFREIEKYNLLLKFLGKNLIALSEEFLVDYRGTGKSQIVLCGLQEYVAGPILDPWRLFGEASLMDILHSHSLVEHAKKNIAIFVKKIRQMIDQTGYIPDLAGIGNLILTCTGDLKLVDINNIVEIKLDDTILLDDKGYPSCDVSIAVLSILEQNLLGRDIPMDDLLYRHFLSTERKDRVKAIEKEFYTNL
ncbi:MAG: hypothetical protein KKF12_21900 [Proteobacteria bacterium]|nr:hypothetical protein [Desulfobacula sp.]MBU3953119.1 hypothetical protein [Pseudomonadota bacterium]MBU4133483.1 hypothetical protein [Pseudomonadota bacterium]